MTAAFFFLMLLFRKARYYYVEIRNSLCYTLEKMLNEMVVGEVLLRDKE